MENYHSVESCDISATAPKTSQTRNSKRKANQPMREGVRKARLAALLPVLLVATFVSFYRHPQPALAQPAEGTLLRTLTIPGSSGVGVGFDGINLYWLDFGGGTLHKITTSGALVADIPIVGCTATAISWDATRGIFWGASGTEISKITTAGVCTPWFNVAGFLPGDCSNGFGCLSLIDGINYDPFDDSIWYSPDASQRIYHYNIPPAPIVGALPHTLPFFDVNVAPNDMVPQCGFNYSSGIATGVGNIMYAGADGCATVFKYDKTTGTKIGFFSIPAQRHEDQECDNITFASLGTDAMWDKDAFDNEIRAFAVPRGTCIAQGVREGRMTGGGSVFTDAVRVTHGFELHCNQTILPNNLEINWDGGNRFHLDSLATAFCFNDPAISPNPPAAGFDTFKGTGTGVLNGAPGATVEWTFTDAGEPGSKDSAKIVIKDFGGSIVLSVSGNLTRGNQQAHNK